MAYGQGSVGSPIVISDDEDISIYRQFVSKSSPRRFPVVHIDRGTHQQGKGHNMLLGMGYRPGQGLGVDLDGKFEPVTVPLKRKRTRSGLGCATADSTAALESPVQSSLTEAKVRHPRKRQKKLERKPGEEHQVAQREGQALQRERPEVMRRMRQRPELNLQRSDASSKSMGRRQMRSGIRTSIGQSASEKYDDDIISADVNAESHGFNGPQTSTGYRQLASTSYFPDNACWKPPHEVIMPVPLLPPIPSLYQPQLLYQPAPPIPPLTDLPCNSTGKETSGTNPLASPLKKSLGPIGMPLSTKPLGAQGTFCLSSQRVPNSSCTLVLEGIPRKFRTPAFIQSWGKSIKGYVKIVHIDMGGPKSFKALVEFATREQARLAYDSPRILGYQGQTGVRAWWYRSTTTPAHERTSLFPTVLAKAMDSNDAKPKRKRRKPVAKKETQDVSPTLASSELRDDSLHAIVHPTKLLDSLEPSSVPMGGLENHNTVLHEGDSSLAVKSLPDCTTQSNIFRPDLELESIIRQPPAIGGEPIGQSQWQDITFSSHTDGSVLIRAPVPQILPFHPPSCLPLNPGGVSAISPSRAFDSPALSASPILSTPTPPSEPRAMKSIPKGPSYQKRLLVTQVKELEEQIAQRKAGLRKLSGNESTSTGLNPPADDTTREENLRRLVLENRSEATRSTSPTPDNTHNSTPDQSSASRRDINRGDGPLTTPGVNAIPISPSGITPASVLPSNGHTYASSSMGTGPVSTEEPPITDLATRFITETIQGLKCSPIHHPSTGHSSNLPSTLSASTERGPTPPSMAKRELAAKHDKLQQNIAESKSLMAELTTAKTKEERDRILVLLRQKTRLPTEPPATAVDSRASGQKCLWPETDENAGVLILSDDEDMLE